MNFVRALIDRRKSGKAGWPVKSSGNNARKKSQMSSYKVRIGPFFLSGLEFEALDIDRHYDDLNTCDRENL
jgi:hypothetical protein